MTDEQIIDYASGERDAEMEAHVAFCPECRSEVESYDRTVKTVQALFAVLTPMQRSSVMACSSWPVRFRRWIRKHLKADQVVEHILHFGDEESAKQRETHMAACTECGAWVERWFQALHDNRGSPLDGYVERLTESLRPLVKSRRDLPLKIQQRGRT